MKRYFPLLFLLQGMLLHAQGLFTPVEADVAARSSAPRAWHPLKYSTWQTDVKTVSDLLASAPMEFTPEAAYMNKTVLGVPQADGSVENYAVYRIMSCEQAVYDKHPEIRTFAGRSVSNPYKTIRGSVTVRGFRAMVFDESLKITMVEPYADNNNMYIAYKTADVPASLRPTDLKREAVGAAMDDQPVIDIPATIAERSDAELVQLKTYRMAVACTGEFAEDHGGTEESAFAAVVEYSNWISGLYERDASLRLQLIEASALVAFTDAANDPYPVNDVGALLGINNLVINGYIGPNFYDVGHVLTRYAGGPQGIGSLEVVCLAGSKAGGASAGIKNVYGEGFIHTFGQELGHQLGGGHTYNFCGDQRFPGEAYEPGSGSTIMSYAGNDCFGNGVQGYADLYFHAGSVAKIKSNYLGNVGSTCGTLTTTDNHFPEVSIPYTDGFFIPISTPFELNGSATDIEGDSLLYCWEQFDTGPETPMDMPVGTCPIFRTFSPKPETNRYFPSLSTILSNGSIPSEKLPTYDRDLTFRLSVREIRGSGNGLAFKDLEFKATESAGPFLVTQPNASSVTWRSGQFHKVLWNVANTDGPLVNCKKVNIRLSTNGGNTFPITLASGVANDGEHTVLVPANHTGNARIRVEAADNIFFDLSNANFKILAPTQASFSAGMSENTATICLPGIFTTEVLTSGVLGFNNPASIEIIPGNLPAGSDISLSAVTVQPGESSTIKVDMSGVSTAGTYQFGVRVTAQDADTTEFTVTVVTTTNDFSTMALQQPADGSTNLSQSQILRWSKAADAISYDLQVASNPTFAPGTILASKTSTQLDTFKIPFLLEKNKAYFWRVRPNNSCSPHPWTEPFFFSTLTENCASYTPNDLPVNISSASANTVESKLEINISSVITDVNIKELRGFHGYFGDLDCKLISPAGTEVTLFKSRCNNYNGVFDLGLDDDAPNSFQCPPNNNGAVYVRPQTPLDVIIDQNAQGTWILRIRDNTPGEGGTVEAFELDVCQAAVVNPPYIINNNTLSITSGTNQQITPDLLLAGDLDNTHDQLTFTLVTVPYNGFLATDAQGTLKPGDQFTQTDIDNGKIRYFDYGLGAGSDYFRFVIYDGAGGYLGHQTYFIAPLVDANQPVLETNDFRLFPNPADDMVWVALEKPATTDITVAVYSTSGQLVRSEVISRGTTRYRIETEGLPKGLYFTQLEGAGGVVVKKLILR